MKICKVKNCKNKYFTKGYCRFHYDRKRHSPHLPLDNKRYSPKGKRNVNWKGGIAEYPNHYLMKKNRLIILMNNPKCEICDKPATDIHHRNGNKADHRLSNLMALCHSCNNLIRFKPNKSKYRKLYGMTLKEMGEKLKLTEVGIRYRLNNPQLKIKTLISLKKT